MNRAAAAATWGSRVSTASTAHDHLTNPRQATYASLGVAAIGGIGSFALRGGGNPRVQLARTITYTALSMMPTVLSNRRNNRI